MHPKVQGHIFTHEKALIRVIFLPIHSHLEPGVFDFMSESPCHGH